MSTLIDFAESGLCPDSPIRFGIRRLLNQRLAWEASDGDYRALIEQLRASEIALHTEAANTQHYEVPPAFFNRVLGARLKYSSGYWPPGVASLDEAELAMLELYAARAQLAPGQRILDLGCGWGSFSLWIAQRWPDVEVTGVSNSTAQRTFIEARARERGLTNIEIVTADVNTLDFAQRFDRVVSVEMFEHVRNYALLLNRISRWLTPDGKLFVHIFCHRNLMYPFETDGADNWMGRLFFTGGLMPAADTLLHFQDDLRLEQRWQVDGTHYQRTARAWLDNLDAHRAELRGVLAATYGADQADRWMQRWRIFFMSCEELFGYRRGREWLVCHYLFGRRS